VAVADGPAALAELSRADAAGAPYPVLLLDAVMPRCNGFALASAIREERGSTARLIMMLSSTDLHADIGRCREVGVTQYLLKPVRDSELRAAITTGLDATPHADGSGAGSEPGPMSTGRTLRILLAEDNVVNQRLVVRLLTKRGHSVQVAGDGQEAIRTLAQEPFDLILMDVQMPEVDGCEATRRIRAAERATGGHVPIIALTAHAMEGDQERCLEAGMDTYLTKPIQSRELFRVIDALSPAARPGMDAESDTALAV
jgi:CheY-like chemotaxis protein